MHTKFGVLKNLIGLKVLDFDSLSQGFAKVVGGV